MIKGKISNGFEYSIDGEVLDDAELLETLTEVDETGSTRVAIIALRAILGEEQKKALYEHLRNPETGRVPITKVMQSLEEILTDAGERKGEIKNS